MNNPTDIILIYRAADGSLHEQPLPDVTYSGIPIDDETAEDLELVSWRFSGGQDYILVEGGLVQNEPGIPVFNLDVLDLDSYQSDEVAEVISLYERIAAHPAAARDWSSALQDAARIIRLYGKPEDIALIEQRENVRLGNPASITEDS